MARTGRGRRVTYAPGTASHSHTHVVRSIGSDQIFYVQIVQFAMPEGLMSKHHVMREIDGRARDEDARRSNSKGAWWPRAQGDVQRTWLMGAGPPPVPGAPGPPAASASRPGGPPGASWPGLCWRWREASGTWPC